MTAKRADSSDNYDFGGVPPSQISLLVIISNGKSLESSLTFLKKRGYLVSVFSSISETMGQIHVIKPQVVLVSWNLKQTNIKKVYHLFTHNFKVKCVVFAEDASTRTANAILNSGIPNTLLAPVSGPGIHARIQTLLRKKADSEIGFSPTKTKKSKSLAKIHEISSQTKWERFSGNGDETVWHGSVIIDGRPLKYEFRGPSQPFYNRQEKKWEGFEGGGPIFLENSQELGAVEVLSENLLETGQVSVLDQSEVLTGTVDWDEEVKNLKGEVFELIDSEESHGKVELAHDKNFSTLAQGVQLALEASTKPSENIPKDIFLTSKVIVNLVESSHYRGYLVSASTDDFGDGAFMDKFITQLSRTMNDLGERLQEPMTKMSLDFEPIEFHLWAQTQASFVISSQNGDHTISIAFVPLHYIPELVATTIDENEVFAIDLKKDFVPNRQIDFDIYLHMPKNNKLILYLKEGSFLSQSKIAKLVGFGVSKVYLRKDQEKLFQLYSAKNKILSALAHVA